MVTMGGRPACGAAAALAPLAALSPVARTLNAGAAANKAATERSRVYFLFMLQPLELGHWVIVGLDISRRRLQHAV
jgi:hypothetical protein